MYNPINMTMPVPSLMESFSIDIINKKEISNDEAVDQFYSEAVFSGGKQTLTPILESITKVKNILDNEINTHESSKGVKKFNPKTYWRNQEFKELENRIQKVFGFRSVNIQPLMEKYDSESKMFQSKLLNAFTYQPENRFPVDGLVTDKGFYDSTHSINLEVIITLGLIKELTPEEILAVLLHELGHNIDPAMVSITYAEINILSKYLTDRKGNLTKTEKKVQVNNKNLLSIFGNLLASIKSASKEFSLKNKKILGSFETRSLDRIKKLIDKDKEQENFSKQSYSEAFADNFARMYGYGPQLMSAIKKMNKSNEDYINSRYQKEKRRQKEILKMVIDALNDEHKTDIHRIRSLIAEYESDIKDPNIPDPIKKQLKDDVEELKKILDSYTKDFSDLHNKINKLIIDELSKEKEEAIKEGFEFFEDEDDDLLVESSNNKDRPITTLFLLMSVDGKISTGSSDELDVDKDFPTIPGVKEGLQQYYDIEQTTDLWSLNSGRVQAKIGVNDYKDEPSKTPVSFVLIDNNHLTTKGVEYFCKKSKTFVIITTNKKHPALNVTADNLHIIEQDKLNIKDALKQLKSKFGCNRITIQTGGTLNGLMLREKLIDYIDIVVAPILIGGKDTSSLIDGQSISSVNELSKLSAMKLEKCKVLKNSYIRLRYKVLSSNNINESSGVVEEFHNIILESKKAYEKLLKRSETVTSAERARFAKLFGYSKKCSLAKDKKGYYVYTHRCRSKSYPTIEDIPRKAVEFVRSTA